MKKRWIIIMVVLALLLCAGCGQQEQRQQPEQQNGAHPGAAAEWMATVTHGDIGSINAAMYPQVSAEMVAQALNAAAPHEITEEEALAAGYGLSLWSLDMGDGTLRAECSMKEPIVYVQTLQGSGYFRSQTLYDLVRHSRDYKETIDETAYARFQPQLDAVMQESLDAYAYGPGAFNAYTLTRFTQVWQYKTDDGNRAELYQFDFALIPDKPGEDFWAGGIYMDSQLRVQGEAACGNVVARYRGDTLLGLVFMGSDNSYIPAFDEDWDWANEMLAAMERMETTTETFSRNDLTVEVTNVLLTKKGTVREDEDRVFENDVFVVLPGATLTVLEAGTFQDTDGVEHGDFLYLAQGGNIRFELWPEMTVDLEEGAAIVDEGFPVLEFEMYAG